MLPRNAELWLPGLIASRWKRSRETPAASCVDIFFCIADHFEPACMQARLATQQARVATWTEHLRRLSEQFRDVDGRPPQHTFFYPEEQYHPSHLEALARLCVSGVGEVEIHLHHHADTAAGLRDKLERFKNRLVGHGLLCHDRRDEQSR